MWCQFFTKLMNTIIQWLSVILLYHDLKKFFHACFLASVEFETQDASPQKSIEHYQVQLLQTAGFRECRIASASSWTSSETQSVLHVAVEILFSSASSKRTYHPDHHAHLEMLSSMALDIAAWHNRGRCVRSILLQVWAILQVLLSRVSGSLLKMMKMKGEKVKISSRTWLNFSVSSDYRRKI